MCSPSLVHPLWVLVAEQVHEGNLPRGCRKAQRSVPRLVRTVGIGMSLQEELGDSHIAAWPQWWNAPGVKGAEQSHPSWHRKLYALQEWRRSIPGGHGAEDVQRRASADINRCNICPPLQQCPHNLGITATLRCTAERRLHRMVEAWQPGCIWVIIQDTLHLRCRVCQNSLRQWRRSASPWCRRGAGRRTRPSTVMQRRGCPHQCCLQLQLCRCRWGCGWSAHTPTATRRCCLELFPSRRS
mmetsp:Transcript_132921/g.323041  ORF Transcript_132921/g.323041 Transcript_132921/m.323041 type:complete len:241 (+) Transcript_132921:373-1095(+)